MYDELELIKRFWQNHGIYKSTVEACKDARNNGFVQTSLKDMVDLYLFMRKIDCFVIRKKGDRLDISNERGNINL